MTRRKAHRIPDSKPKNETAVPYAVHDLLAAHIVITSSSQVGYKFLHCSLWSKLLPPSYRLLDNLKMPARSSGFHICDILDLNDAAGEGKPSVGGEGVAEAPHHLHHNGTYCSGQPKRGSPPLYELERL
jgi:hypothetical protein